MARDVRRVVTGHDENGKAVVISDAPAPYVHVNRIDPEWYSTDLFRTGETPARDPGADAGDRPTVRAGRCRTRTAPCCASTTSRQNRRRSAWTPDDARRAFAALGNEGASTLGAAAITR